MEAFKDVPSVVGKRDEQGASASAPERRRAHADDGRGGAGLADAPLVAEVRDLEQDLARLEAFEHPANAPSPMALQRTPYFCSGCPHNTSTKVPEGEPRAMARIGFHGMALSVPSRRTATISHMGARGRDLDRSRRSLPDEAHIFQNLGDGTYTHSGLLALRAAAAAGVNFT